jgi:hypothetical protein
MIEGILLHNLLQDVLILLLDETLTVIYHILCHVNISHSPDNVTRDINGSTISVGSSNGRWVEILRLNHNDLLGLEWVNPIVTTLLNGTIILSIHGNNNCRVGVTLAEAHCEDESNEDHSTWDTQQCKSIGVTSKYTNQDECNHPETKDDIPHAGA